MTSLKVRSKPVNIFEDVRILGFGAVGGVCQPLAETAVSLFIEVIIFDENEVLQVFGKSVKARADNLSCEGRAVECDICHSEQLL